MKIIIRILAVAVTVFFLPQILSAIGVSGVSVNGLSAAFAVSIALAVVNLLIKPIISLVTLPLNLVTFGIFGLVVNGVIFYFIPFFPFVAGFGIATFWAAFVGALIISVVNWLVSKL
ncbi:MAG: phage holin family protein [Candidatus Paceibacterota bacterium]|jgi:putative membrane protein